MKDDRVYLQHIRDALEDIATYVGAGRDAFFAERMRQDATIRKLQVIGEIEDTTCPRHVDENCRLARWRPSGAVFWNSINMPMRPQ